MAFSLSTLLSYRSRSNPNLKLFYKPIGKRQQRVYRRQLPTYGDPMKLLTTVLVKYGVLLENDETGSSEYLGDGANLRRIPGDFLIEGGAAVLGWKRDEDESAADFSARLKKELLDAYQHPEGAARDAEGS